jgi:hypothetical protein
MKSLWRMIVRFIKNEWFLLVLIAAIGLLFGIFEMF